MGRQCKAWEKACPEGVTCVCGAKLGNLLCRVTMKGGKRLNGSFVAKVFRAPSYCLITIESATN